ncbi:MAG TPA: ScyD/ScyE family protein [Blastocatellia bacterium]|nr:ScyD/ScyE family protein [Blastocatellia bacterium]
MKNLMRLAVLAFMAVALSSVNAMAQNTSVFVAGLKAPSKLITTPRGNLIVAEAGTGAMDGRISIIDQSGTRRTLVEGLPSAINLLGGEASPSGPSGLALRGRTLYITIGSGDAVLPGPVPGSETPNPSPSSSLFTSVLALRFDAQVEDSGGNFTITQSDYAALNTGAKIKVTNANGQKLVLDVVTKFRSFREEARPDFPNNVRASNPFGVAINQDKLYVVDAGHNLLREVEITTGDSRVMAIFAPKPNPLPFGPPFVDAVPDSVKVFGNKQLLVTFLTGFPFAPGQAEVRKINRVNDSQRTFIAGLSSAIDVVPFTAQSGQDQFYTLEFSTNMLMNSPGRIQFFSSADAAPVVVTGGLISPTSLARDEMTGTLYVTEMFTGRIIKVQVQ